MGAVLDKIVIVGHRGAGKSSLLNRWKVYAPYLTFADLDDEIEKIDRLSIAEIFNQKGEIYFRELEKKVWNQIQNFDVISVGGGFNLSWITFDRRILWVRRDSDSPDRIFLDRPVLTDYKKRFQERQKHFQEKADLIYTIPEGIFHPDDEEKRILLNNFNDIGGTVTLPKKVYPGVLVEVRDDLKPTRYQTTDLLYSVRVGTDYPQNTKIDWDIKNPLPEGLHPYIISSHESHLEALSPYEKEEIILKFCPEVTSWSHLAAGFEWQKKNPAKHVFLPRSADGRWAWFRLWMKGKQPLNFWREGEGSAWDQPTLWEWLGHPLNVQTFAAVLGAPVKHSYSPVYHKSFFLKKNIPFYRIHIEENEWDEAISILSLMGLCAAAITSPLKIKAGNFVSKPALNTLWKVGNQWSGVSTDEVGARALLEPFQNHTSVIWGGGGILETLKNILPQASFYSSQKAEPRMGFQKNDNPEVLVWADPHNSLDKVPLSWNPRVVVDLSYHDKSPARLYAQKTKSKYISGLEMFFAQAVEQQKYWNQLWP